MISLTVGIYEDIHNVEYDAFGNKIAGVKWVEGVAIIVAVSLVVIVGSVNDFQKERQFRNLNKKKEDRLVSVSFMQSSNLLYFFFTKNNFLLPSSFLPPPSLFY